MNPFQGFLGMLLNQGGGGAPKSMANMPAPKPAPGNPQPGGELGQVLAGQPQMGGSAQPSRSASLPGFGLLQQLMSRGNPGMGGFGSMFGR